MKTIKLKTVVTLLAVASALFKTYAQQEAMYSQYMFNTQALNPAYVGTKELYNATLLQRNQWVGFEGAPITTSLSINSPFIFKKMGVGLTYVRDEIGPIVTSNIFVDVASRVQVTKDGFLAGGIKIGFDGRKTNLTELDPLDETDIAYNQNAVKKLSPNLGAGIYYYTNDYYIGLSSPKVAQTRIPYGDGSANGEQVKRHYYFIGGYVHQINPDWKIRPSFITKKVAGAPYSLDITGAAMYQEKIIGGISYRIGDSFGAMVQYKPMPRLWIGYTYDLITSQLARYNGGTHEIMISYDFDLNLDFKQKERVTF